LRFQKLPETTYLFTTVILIEDKQYAKIDKGGLFSSCSRPLIGLEPYAMGGGGRG